MGQKLRQVRFSNFDELTADVATLRGRSYEQGGEWDLSKIEDHLAKSIVAPLDGEGPRLIWPASAVARWIVTRMVQTQQYPQFQFPAPKFMQPRPDVRPEQADAAFDEALVRARQQNGPTVTTRAFGTFRTEIWKGLQLLHAAHHLSFLNPKE